MKSTLVSTTLNRLLMIFTVVVVSAGTALAGGPKLLYSFQGTGDGSNPAGNLISDSAGNLYGTTEFSGSSFYGTVFELSPPAKPSDPWIETTLYSFGNFGDGARPTDGLIFDQAGNLYGTTSDTDAGGYGEIFQLSPPAQPGGAWTESVLYSFNGQEGSYPHGGLIFDPAGNLYGTSDSSVFELSPPAQQGGPWVFTVLHNFTCCTSDGWSSLVGLVRDQAGNLYGTTEWGGFFGTDYCSYLGCGTVFEVSPPSTPGGQWTEKVLYSFKSNIGGYTDGFIPYSALTLDTSGNLFGTTYSGGTLGGGVAFQLTPTHDQSARWIETIIHNFSYSTADGAAPIASMILDKAGNLYGTTFLGANPCFYNGATYGCGIVFEMVRPTSIHGVWSETELARFTLSKTSPTHPGASLMFDGAGNLYGTTIYGGTGACTETANGCGTVFKIGR